MTCSRKISLTLRGDRGLATKLLEHLGSTSQLITARTNADVKNKLLNLELLHRVDFVLVGLGNLLLLSLKYKSKMP